MVSKAQRLKSSWGHVERREGVRDSSRPRRRAAGYGVSEPKKGKKIISTEERV